MRKLVRSLFSSLPLARLLALLTLSSSPDNGTYCVHPSQNHTAPPSNVNDEDLGDEYFERPMSEYTVSFDLRVLDQERLLTSSRL